MFTTILIILVFLFFLCGISFAPGVEFSSTYRGIIGGVVFVLFVFWVLKYSVFAVF